LAAGAEHDSGDGTARAGKIGRRFAIGIYLVVLLYITTVAFGAVVPQVFWPEASQEAVARAPQDCREGMLALERTLLTRAAIHVGPNEPGAEREPLDAFWRAWDDDYVALSSPCGGETHASLGRLRYQLEITLRRFEREDARLAREVERRLATSR